MLIKQNPLLVVQPRLLLLKWSPPYLWPGHRIKYYNVSTTSLNDGAIMYDIVNGTFSDHVITLEKPQPDQQCIEYRFEISAINNENELLQSFTASGGYLQG